MVSQVGDNITGDSALSGMCADPVSELTFCLCACALVVPKLNNSNKSRHPKAHLGGRPVKSKRSSSRQKKVTSGRVVKVARKQATLTQVNEHAAGIDIGSVSHFVAVPPSSCRSEEHTSEL